MGLFFFVRIVRMNIGVYGFKVLNIVFIFFLGEDLNEFFGCFCIIVGFFIIMFCWL